MSAGLYVGALTFKRDEPWVATLDWITAARKVLIVVKSEKNVRSDATGWHLSSCCLSKKIVCLVKENVREQNVGRVNSAIF